MKNKTKLLMAGAVLALGAAVPAIAQAGGDSETPIPGSDIEVLYTVDYPLQLVGVKNLDIAGASAAAIEHLGGGQVTDTEIGDEESYYEVEVTRDDGGQVDVQLDQNLNIVGSENEVGAEDEGAEDEGAEESSEADSEAPIPGPDIEVLYTVDYPLQLVGVKNLDIDRASAAAIEHLGGGRVTDTEVGDEESYYEVEVTLEDGRQVDVQLDENFNVVGTEDDGTEDEESAGG